MSVTQTWNMLLIPETHHEVVLEEYCLALEKAEEYRKANISVIEEWRRHPESFGWYMLACDVNDRHLFYNSWVDWKIIEKFYGFFVLDVFGHLFFKYSKFCGPKDKAGEFEMAEVIVTNGETAPHVLYQSIGEEALEKLPGFFGNFYIAEEDVLKELELYNILLSNYQWEKLVRRGAVFYNAPCNNGDDTDIAEEVLSALPKALKYAKEKNCGLLGLVVTAG
jgi:hypothetical protein